MCQAIGKLQDANIKVGIVTGSDMEYIREQCSLFWDMSPVNPSEILFIGDTIHDKDIADIIGSDCILIAKGHVSKKRLIETGARVFNELNEIKNWL